MDDTTARALLLLRAHEQAAGPLWTADDAAWASRLAAESVPAEAPPERFLAERARHAMQRLLPRDPAARRWLERRGWRPGWLLAAAGAGAAAGLLADLLGRSAIVDILAPAAWGVMAWNLAVYLLLLAGTLRAGDPGGPLRRAIAAAWRRGGGAGPLREAAAQWAALAVPQTLSRAAALLHLAAAALGGGLVAAMYLRGLVFDFRAGWQSTFLDAATVQRALSLLLAPASALTGIALPDAAGIAALRLAPAAPPPAASAAPWIHLYAAMLALVVIGPRLLLAGLALGRAAWQARHVELALDDGYFQQLIGRRRGAIACVQVCPYAAAPPASVALALRARLAREFGEAIDVQLAPTVRMGDEESAAPPPLDPPPGLRLVLVDLGSTPEAETVGRYLAALRRAAPAMPLRLVADEADFVRRFGTLAGRVDERRAAWRRFADAAGVPFEAADLGGSAR